MAYKIILVLLILGVVLSGCVDSPEKAIVGTYVSDSDSNSYFTLYNNETYLMHYSNGGNKTGYYSYDNNNGLLVFENYYAGSPYIFEQEHKTNPVFINNLGGRYVKK